MPSNSTSRLLRVSIRQKCPIISTAIRQFSTTRETKARNRVYTPVRRDDEFQSYLSLSASSRMPLLTFWKASYCQTCKAVSPILNELVSAGIGEEEGGVTLCEIEYDSQDIMDSGLALRYMITSMPTLLSFDRGEAQMGTRVTDPKLMRDREWLRDWIRTEARRRGSGGDGGTVLGGSIFGGLFGKLK